jgi:hypothetical protein
VAELAEIRTLKLNLLADVNQFGAGMTQAETSVNGFGGTVNKVSKMAQAAFAAMAVSAAYAAIKIGKDSVEAAIADEKSQVTLAKALQNTTKATDAQIAATEDWITAQQLSYGIADTKLRPAIANLSRATGDLTKAQELTSIALDISASTGKDVESVSLALAKAYNGNIGALTKLGIPLDENIKKTKDFDVVQTKLVELFGGAAAANADTYAGKLAILSERTGELKESVGVLLLPQIEKLVGFANERLLPALEQLAAGFAGTPMSTESSAYFLGEAIKELTDAFGKLFSVINADTENSTNNISRLAAAISTLAGAIDFVATAVGKFTDQWNRLPPLAQQLLLGGFGLVQRAFPTLPESNAGSLGLTAPTAAQQTALSQQNITVNLNGVVDGESARRSIEKVLQNSGSRTSPVKLARLPL